MRDTTIAWPLVAIAAIGGVLVVGAELLEIRNTPKDQRPDFKDKWFWYPYFFHPVAGAILAGIYELSATQLNPFLALNIGASAPLIVRALAQANPIQGPIDPGPGG